MLQKTIERKKHYENLGSENNVVLEELKILKHKELPSVYFVYAKYLVGDGGQFKESEVLESLDENGEWVDAKKDFSEMEFGGFLKDCEVCNF